MPSIKFCGVVGGKTRRIEEQLPSNFLTLREGIEWFAERYNLTVEEIQTEHLITIDSMPVSTIDEALPMQPDSEVKIIPIIVGG